MKRSKFHIRLAIVLLTLIAIAAACATIVFWVGYKEKPIFLKTFISKDDLVGFISAKIRAAESDPLIWRLIGPFRTTMGVPTEAVPLTPKGTIEYSTTNIQVEGVDEADIVKTDGQIIYAATSGGLINIIKAYPPEEMRILSKIKVDGEIIGLFIGDGRLVVLLEESVKIFPLLEKEEAAIPILPPPSWRTVIKVYNVLTPEKPTIAGEVAFEGSYVSSRMIGNYVYVVLTYQIWAENLTILPRWAVSDAWREIPPTDIYYSDSIEAPSSYTLIAAIDTSDVSRTAMKAVVTGYASCIYMSRGNLYVTYTTINRLLGGWGKTEVYRIVVKGPKIECEARGEVPGKVLNQFSMDEHNGYFRAATTITIFSSRGDVKTENNIYVLKTDNLEVVGKIEGLAPGERIYAARFMGDRCYLVTFKKVDPLFTIDLSDPENPKVLGALKIPGYSDYLHPYDENHLIGIGKEAVQAEEGDFAWYQGLKISLFDISDIKNPKEVSKIIIGERGTESPVLGDHHALLFDRRRNLLVIPILEARIFEEDYPEGIPPWAYGRPIFQGAYIFHVSPGGGIILKSKITHIENGNINPIYEVKRALYIDKILYTISDGKIKANNLNNLSEITEILLEQ